MSVALMTLAFRTTLPATRKLVLLALADAANDQGECYPSISALESKCSLSDRAVQKAIAELELSGHVRREYRNGRSTVYWITPEPAQTPERRSPPNVVHPEPRSPAPERRSPPPPNVVHPTPERGSPITINEPSKEPLPNRKTPAVADVSASVYADWLALRKAKRAPVTETAIAGIRREAEKAGLSMQAALELCCQRGWTGFRADWVAGPSVAALKPNKQEALEERNRAVGLAWLAKQEGA